MHVHRIGVCIYVYALCMYIYIHTHRCMYAARWLQAHLHRCVCVFTSMYMRVYVYAYICICIRICVWYFVFTQAQVYVCVHTCIQHIFTYFSTYMNKLVRQPSGSSRTRACLCCSGSTSAASPSPRRTLAPERSQQSPSIQRPAFGLGLPGFPQR